MPSDRSPSLRFHALSLAILAALGIALYGHTLEAELMLDDWDNIVDNPWVRWKELSWENAIGAVTGPRVHRPVAHLSFGLDHWIGGGDVRGYRITNLAIHVLNGFLVYAFALRIFRALARQRGGETGGEAWAALLAALVFLAHPLQIQSVTYVVQRMSSLAAGFYLGALLLYDRARACPRRGRRRAWLGAAGACGVLALGSKEIAVTLPLAAWLYAWLFLEDLRPDALRRRLPWLAAIGLAAGVAAVLFAGSPRYASLDFDAGERLLTQARVIVFYLSLVLWPLPSRLNLLHHFEPSRSLVEPVSTLLCALLLLALGIVAVLAARRQRLLAFAILWLFLHLALESSTLPLRMAFEHRLYLPLVGLALLAGQPLWAADPRRRHAVALLALLCVGALSTATWLRNETWSDGSALRRDIAAKSPRDFLARMQLASVLAREGQLERALAEVEVSIALEPRSPRPWNLKATLLAALERPHQALEAYRRAAALDAADPRSRALAAELLARGDRLDEAARLYADALAISPDPRWARALAELRVRQGRSQWEAGRFPEAIARYEEALAADPAWALPAIDLASMLVRVADPALRDPRRATRLAERGLGLAGDDEDEAARARRVLDAARAGSAAP